MKDRIEHDPEQRLSECQPPDKRSSEQDVNDCRLELDKQIIIQDQCQPTEYKHDHGSDQGHYREVSCHSVGNSKRSENRRHEHAGRDVDSTLWIRGKEQNQGLKIEHKPKHRTELLIRHSVPYLRPKPDECARK